jgi:hypothetical protein
MPAAPLPYTADFSADLKWTTNCTSRYYWDCPLGVYQADAININAGGYYAYREVDYTGGSFCLRWDMIAHSVAYGCAVNFGLYGCGMNSDDGAPFAQVHFGCEDRGYLMALRWTTGLVPDGGNSNPTQFSREVWYRIEMSYNADTRILSATVKHRDSGETVWHFEAHNAGPFGSDMRYLGTSHVRLGTFQVPGVQALADFDNISMQTIPCPSTPECNINPQFVTRWGTRGDSEGEFLHPVAVEAHPNGSVYVVDGWRNKILIFASDDGVNYDSVKEWGGAGSGPGQFAEPRSIAFDHAGAYAYVADFYNHRIQKFTSSGDFVSEWGHYGDGDGEFRYPDCLAVNANGEVFVSDLDNNRIQVFTGDGVFLRKWGSYGTGPGQLIGPHEIDFDSAGNVYVSENLGNRVQKFTPAGEHIGFLGAGGCGAELIQTPAGIAIDRNDTVFVVCILANHVLQFSSAGCYEGQWGRPGSGDGEFSWPVGIDADDGGAIFTAEVAFGNCRIQKFQSPADCNHNRVPDECDIANGTSRDRNANGIPDECECQPPEVVPGPGGTINEGGTFYGYGSFIDPDQDTWTATVDYGDGSGPQPLPLNTVDKTFELSHIYADNGAYTVTVRIDDNSCGADTGTLDVTADNVPPVVGAIVAPQDPVQVGVVVNASTDFFDPGVLDTHTALWAWGDGTTSPGEVIEENGSGSVRGAHVYAAPGVYTVKVTVTDKDGGIGEATYQYVVVYDPTGGFVTGGGWIESPAGAYVADPALTGKAVFGFVSKYQKGATVPTGQTEFQFKVANLNFHSDSYEWLVVAGARAKYKGTGTINGAGNYIFMLSAIDGQVSGGGGTDKFRIKIRTQGTDVPIYDNQFGAADGDDPTTVVGGGSVVIHRN